ncbi:MAG: sodium:solute symporter family protein [Thermoflavifilum sp.]|uniref:sodium:solute symporter family protein n=1 Tax=Thermoflavifilum sp. TaxID=1968839 RepID=UPI0018A42C1B|nr:sodium:solute symporter family protein [Thermoflavifilum sp.]QOR75429.1 MAG: sodium:solute symporter family protein [Thermoflavifilum sp.]
MKLHFIDYLIIALYFVFVIGIGFLIRRKVKSSNDFLMSGRSIPLWIASLAFISANLGAQEVIGMAASGAKYGIMTSHFYWLGAIPAMLFLGLFMMPFYYGSQARSVPEYLAKRYDEKTRAFNAVTFAVMTIFSSGISLYALAKLFEVILGWSFELSIYLSAGIVLIYTFLGGLTSAVYNEVLQFFLIVLGIAPLVIIGIHQAGGWHGVVSRLPDAMVHAWKYMGSAQDNPMGVDVWSLALGLGFVLSFGYWCTDFLVVQRAMVAHNMAAAEKTPLIAAFPKMLMPFVVILPGLIAMALMHTPGSDYRLPYKPDGVTLDYDMALPSLLAHDYPSGILGVGLTALFASFMSGMAGNVTAFNTVWTYDIYQSYIQRNKPDSHYLRIGRIATVFGIVASIATAYLARSFNNIMDFLQLVFGFVNAPLFATFFLGMFWKRTTGHGAFWGLIGGTVAAACTHGLTLAEGKGAWLGANLHTFHSTMGQNFVIAIVAFTSCFLLTAFISLFTRPHPEQQLVGLVYSLTPKPDTGHLAWYQKPAMLALLVLVLVLLLNLIFM